MSYQCKKLINDPNGEIPKFHLFLCNYSFSFGFFVVQSLTLRVHVVFICLGTIADFGWRLSDVLCRDFDLVCLDSFRFGFGLCV